MSHCTSRLLVIGLLLFLVSLTPVGAVNTLEASPSEIFPNEKVTVTFTSSGSTQIDKIEIIGPDGTSYMIDYSPNVELSDAETLVEEFGTGVSGWNPAADTSKEGSYTIALTSASPSYQVTAEFYVAVGFYFPEYGNRVERFSVPEFSFPAFVFTILGFALLNIKRRFLKK